MSSISTLNTLDYEDIEIVIASRKDVFLLMRRQLRQRLDTTDKKLSNEVGELITEFMSGKMKQNRFINTFIVFEVKNKVGPHHWEEILNSIKGFIDDKGLLPKKDRGKLTLVD